MNATTEIRRGTRLAHYVIAVFAVLEVSSTATTAQQPLAQETTTPSAARPISDSKVRTNFALKRISDGTLCPLSNLNCEDSNIWWENFTLLASNGHTLNLMSIPFPSIARSKKEFESTAKNADKIIRRDAEMNSKGEQVGERALGFFPENKGMKSPADVPHYELFWMRGPNYWVVTGEYLDDVLALEERLKEEGLNAVWGWRANYPVRPD
jgi:hypothetical protein